MADESTRYGDGGWRVVVAGGGIAALEAVLALRMLAGEGIAIEVWSDEQDFVYRPLAVAVPFLVGEVRRYPLDRLVALAGGKLRAGRVLSVDPERRVLATGAEGTDAEVGYDDLLLALGARSTVGIRGALTFRGPEDDAALADLLATVVGGVTRRLVFALPTGPTRPLPLYELALETRNYLSERGTRGVEILIVTPEQAPLEMLGAEASAAMRELLDARGIELIPASAPDRFVDGQLHRVAGAPLEADAVVAMARLEGQALPGIPSDDGGFVPVDEHGRVIGLDAVYAAGDMTSFPIKQGGIATQQADAAAAAIAASLGYALEPAPFRPVVRSQLLTGIFPRYFESDESSARHAHGTQAPWWPPAKVVGRYLTPFLATHVGLGRAEPPAGIAIGGVELERGPDGTWAPI